MSMEQNSLMEIPLSSPLSLFPRRRRSILRQRASSHRQGLETLDRISIKSLPNPSLKRPDREEQVGEMNSLPRSDHSSEMKCCGNSGCQTSTVVPKKRRTMSISSILARFDEHFRWTYGWYHGSVTFGIAGFGFLLDDHHGAGKILEATHIINGKEARIGRILFVGGLQETTTAEALKDFFSKHGNVKDHEIALIFRSSIHSDFGFIEFDSDKPVDDLSARGKIDFYGKEVVLKKASLLRRDKPASWPRGVIDTADEPLGRGGFGCVYGGTWMETVTDDEEESDGDNAGDPSPPMDPEYELQIFESVLPLLPKKLRNLTRWREWREALKVEEQKEKEGRLRFKEYHKMCALKRSEVFE